MLKDQGGAIARISRLRCSSKHSYLVQPGPCVVRPCPGILHMALCLSTSWSPKIAFLLDIVKAPLRQQLACLRWVCFEGPTQLKGWTDFGDEGSCDLTITFAQFRGEINTDVGCWNDLSCSHEHPCHPDHEVNSTRMAVGGNCIGDPRSDVWGNWLGGCRTGS